MGTKLSSIISYQYRKIDIYGEAISAYVDLVADRSLAIYLVGNLRDDSLSDIDLLVVPKAGLRSNSSELFSAKQQLPRFRKFYPHDPRILPRQTVNVIKYTSHHARNLIHGLDLLDSICMDNTPEQQWSLLLEGYLKYRRFNCRMKRHGGASPDRLVSKATSITYSLQLLDELTGTQFSDGYPDCIAGFREQLKTYSQKTILSEIKVAYLDAFSLMKRKLKETLPVNRGESIAHFSKEFLLKGKPFPPLDESLLRERRLLIRSYHQSLVQGGFFLGSLFSKAVYKHQLKPKTGEILPNLGS